MSKLFDQLKDAARDREGGLLMGALAKKQAEEAAAAAAAAAKPAEPQATPGGPSRAPAAALPLTPEIDPAATAASGSPLGGIALAAAIFGIAVLAWHSAPWRAPQKTKIDADSLKLDRSLSLDRPSEANRTADPLNRKDDEGRSSPRGPAPSR